MYFKRPVERHLQQFSHLCCCCCYNQPASQPTACMHDLIHCCMQSCGIRWTVWWFQPACCCCSSIAACMHAWKLYSVLHACKLYSVSCDLFMIIIGWYRYYCDHRYTPPNSNAVSSYCTNVMLRWCRRLSCTRCSNYHRRLIYISFVLVLHATGSGVVNPFVP